MDPFLLFYLLSSNLDNDDDDDDIDIDFISGKPSKFLDLCDKFPFAPVLIGLVLGSLPLILPLIIVKYLL